MALLPIHWKVIGRAFVGSTFTFYFLFWDSVLLYTSQSSLKLTIICCSIPSADITGLDKHAWLELFLKLKEKWMKFKPILGHDKSWKCYVKWNRPDTKRQVLDITYMRDLEQASVEGEGSIRATHGWRKQVWERLCNECGVSVWDDEKVLVMDNDGSTAL